MVHVLVFPMVIFKKISRKSENTAMLLKCENCNCYTMISIPNVAIAMFRALELPKWERKLHFEFFVSGNIFRLHFLFVFDPPQKTSNSARFGFSNVISKKTREKLKKPQYFWNRQLGVDSQWCASETCKYDLSRPETVEMIMKIAFLVFLSGKNRVRFSLLF